MIAKFISPLRNLSIDKKHVFSDGLVLNNDTAYINNYFSENYFIERIGQLDQYNLLSEVTISTRKDIDDNVNVYLKVFNEYIQVHLLSFWLVKDNSIHNKFGLINTSQQHVARSIGDLTPSNSNGEFSNTHYSEQELIEVNRYRGLIEPIVIRRGNINSPPLNNHDVAGNTSPATASFFSYIPTRLERAFTFLALARATPSLPDKIYRYMATLETLFTTDDSGVKYNLSKNAAIYLTSNESEQLSAYCLLREGYKIRSKYIHGDVIDKDRNYLLTLSSNIDNMIRKIFQKIVDGNVATFEMTRADLRNYFAAQQSAVIPNDPSIDVCNNN